MSDRLALVREARPPRTERVPEPLRVALVGNPNCGKSTIFNALTGLRQRVANFPGVTVERVEGSYRYAGTSVALIDLPGMHGLAPESPAEAIAVDAVLGRVQDLPPADVLVVVLDAENLQGSLYLASRILELGRPTVIALNRVDRLNAAGVSVDVIELIHELEAVVIPLVATSGEGIGRLRHAIDRAAELPRARLRLVTEEVERRISRGGDTAAAAAADAEARHRWVAGVMERAVRRRPPSARTPGDRVDAIVLHRTWGPLVFLAVMVLMFQAMFTWARPFAGGIQSLVALAGVVLTGLIPAGELRSLLVDGALNGVGSVLVFLPQIAILFLFIGLLEDSGYMARAALVMNRWMRPLGLHAESFIPLISGYACAVPAILSTRTIRDPKERLATILVVPLMSCSARLPVYALLVGAFVPATVVAGVSLQGLAMLAMYLLGTVAALASAAIFRRTLLKSETRSLSIELPPYALPSARALASSVWQRVRVFLRLAGTVIFALSILFWALASYPKPKPGPGEVVTAEQQLSRSALGTIGHVIEPAVRPLGYDWKIAVSMVASFAAREVFVSTMGTIYGVARGDGEAPALADRIRAERNPETGRPVYTPLVAFGLLAFYVFALMCTSTLTMTVRETGGGWRGAGWAALQFAYMLALAYGTAFLIFRGGLALGLGGGA